MKYIQTILLFWNSFFLTAQNSADRIRLKSEDGIDVFYAYDAQGRLSQQRSSMYSFYESYVYRNDSILIYAVDLPDSTLEKVYKLNKEGLLSELHILNGHETYVEYYEYNDRMLTKTFHHYPNDGQSTVYEINEGNQQKEIFQDTSFQGNNYLYQLSEYAYTYSNKQNPLSNENFGQAYLGISNKNLIDKCIYTSSYSDFCPALPCPLKPETQNTDEYLYEYVLDEKGRVKAEIKTYKANQKQMKTKYYY